MHGKIKPMYVQVLLCEIELMSESPTRGEGKGDTWMKIGTEIHVLNK